MSGIWEVALGLLVVVAAIVAIGWFMRRLYPGGMAGIQALKVLAALSLGPRERVLLIDSGGVQLLIGVTTQQITSLHRFTEPVLLPEATNAGDFALRLKEALGRGVRP